MRPKTTIWAVPLLLPLLCLAADTGSTVGADVTLEAYSALRGGADQGAGLHGTALIHSTYTPSVTKDQPLSWTGYVSVLAIAGRGPTERFLGDFLAASNIEGYRSVRVYAWWLEAQHNAWSLRGGALLADEEFAGTDAGGNLFNSAFGWPAFISANTVNTGPAYYVAAPGIRLQRTWGETAAWRLGLYDGDAFDSPTGDPGPTRHGLHYQLGGNQGFFLITEATFAPAGGATRLKVGGWLHTATFSDMRDDAAGIPFTVSGNAPAEHGSNHGIYAAVEHTLAGETGKAGNVEIFLRGGASPADRNTIGWAVDGGLAWTGPIPGRPADILAVGVVHARFSPAYSDNARMADPTSAAPDFEQVFEANYTFSLSEKLSLQPDLQFIRHPGGSTGQRDAVALLFRLNASY